VSPEVIEAIGRLRAEEILSDAQAPRLLRVARRELVSARGELRALMYAGVLLLASGVALFLKEHHERIGPAAIAAFLFAVSAACVLFVHRSSPDFSWRETSSPSVAADYVLLLGLLLFSADLAYVETQFDALGKDWPYHLLIVSLVYFAAAYRYDSRVVLSLALTSFAAWRGVSVAKGFASLSPERGAALRLNTLLCAAFFLAAAVLSERAARKPHFAPVWRVSGLLLLFGGLLHGVFQRAGSSWFVWELFMLGAGGAVLAFSYRRRRSLDFSIAAIAAYIGFLRWISDLLDGTAYHFTAAVTSLIVLALLVWTHRQIKESE